MKLNHLAGAAILLAASTQAPLAIPISGNIGITGSLTYNTSSSGTATEETSWIDPHVVSDTGGFAVPSLFAITPGTPAIMSPATWNFNTSTPINGFWAVGGFTFQLLSSFIASQGSSGGMAYLYVDGTGLVSGNGYTPTVMSFNLTSQDPIAGVNGGVNSWTFSASGATTIPSVPDGGSTVMLMGLALTGVAWLRRKDRRSNPPA
jgi:hypothetical protein